MSAGISYEILPRVKTYPIGTIFRNKVEITGTNACGVNKSDELYEFGNEPITIPENTTLTFVQDKQFIAAGELEGQKKGLSAWTRFHFLKEDGKVIWVTISCVPPRIWNFETYSGKEKIIKKTVDELFEIIKLGAEHAK